MKKMSPPLSLIRLYLLIFCTLALVVSPVQAKKRCKPLLEKLHNVQAMQRSSYSLKRGQSLRAKEDKARDKWWACEHSSRFTKTKGKKNSKKSNKKTRKKKNKKTVKYKKKRKYQMKKGSEAPFRNSSAIVIKSKYQGNKKFAWLAFYQQPVECQRPKKLAVFAACSEDKQAQQVKFEQQYVK
jgi:hypothetical protein